MEVQVLARIHPRLGVVFRVEGIGCHGAVVADTGEWWLWATPPSVPVCRVTEAVTRALAEWYRLDAEQYGGANAAKVRRRLEAGR